MPTRDPDGVSIVGIGQVPVRREHPTGLRELGAEAVRLAMADAGLERVDALFVGNMLADELQGQKHLATLIGDEAGLYGIEALEVRAATATGAASLRMAYLAVASGQAETAISLGVEKMSSHRDHVVSALAKGLDAEQEIPVPGSLLAMNAALMQLYLERYGRSITDFDGFALNAHRNAAGNPNALFHDRQVTRQEIDSAAIVSAPLRRFDAAPICDGAAAVVLTANPRAREYTDTPVAMLGASVTTDRFRVADRDDPLVLTAATRSAREAFRRAGVQPSDIGLFEVHDAFSIMSCLILEAVGFAAPGEGWRLAAEGHIFREGRLPISTMGGLKARGHPIGASGIYQTCEIVQQLTGRAGANQLPDPRLALLQSVGGAGGTVLTHIFGV